MVEMAVLLPVLLLLVGGIIDFGRFLYYKNEAAQVARGAVRSGVVAPTSAQIDSNINYYITNYPVSGYSLDNSITPNPSSSDCITGATVTYPPAVGSANTCITVSIKRADYTPIFKNVPGLKNLLSTPPTASATMRYEN